VQKEKHPLQPSESDTSYSLRYNNLPKLLTKSSRELALLKSSRPSKLKNTSLSFKAEISNQQTPRITAKDFAHLSETILSCIVSKATIRQSDSTDPHSIGKHRHQYTLHPCEKPGQSSWLKTEYTARNPLPQTRAFC
jgi:Golgi nucleoside diphosphatase